MRPQLEMSCVRLKIRTVPRSWEKVWVFMRTAEVRKGCQILWRHKLVPSQVGQLVSGKLIDGLYLSILVNAMLESTTYRVSWLKQSDFDGLNVMEFVSCVQILQSDEAWWPGTNNSDSHSTKWESTTDVQILRGEKGWALIATSIFFSRCEYDWNVHRDLWDR